MKNVSNLPSKLIASLVLCLVAVAAARAEQSFNRQEDVIYGRKFGTALTMDVFTPKQGTNGAGVILCVSGGWVSNHDQIQPIFSDLLYSGFTVFAVVHGSQPKFTIPECVADMHRAVRYIRGHAADFHIDPNRLGITGASAGGHLSLMIGCAGCEGDSSAKDPIDRLSSRVQAVACFFPPTDFLNYGKPGVKSMGIEPEHKFKAPFDFKVQDPITKLLQPVDLTTREQICKDMSPCYHVSKDDPPTLIIHGDSDPLVPLQQSELIMDRFKEAGVPARLIVKEGAKHGWPTIFVDFKTIADWFEKYLKPSSATAQAGG